MNHINPKIWGPSSWETLYYIIYAYPVNPTDDDKQNMKEYINSYFKVLPCG